MGGLAAREPRAHAAETVSAARRREFLASDGVRLSCLDSVANPRDGVPTLVLVPGWSMPGSIWRAQIEGLAPYFRVVAMDPRGQGESEVARDGYTAERRARDIAELVAPLGRVVLVGWSLAVLESLQLVKQSGEAQLAALVLVDNSVGEPPAPAPSDFIRNLRADRRGTLERFCRSMFAKTRPEAEIRELVDGALRMPLQASVALLSYPYPREYWRDIARSCRAPLAYVVGRAFEAQARSLAQHRQGTLVEVFADAGHALFVDQPERFNAVLRGIAERSA